MRYFFHPPCAGVVLPSHGTGGSGNFINKVDTFAVALALVAKGYCMVSADAGESVAGDLNGDGKQRWNTALIADNIDLKNLETLFAVWETLGLVPASTPRFALGMSNGGGFSIALGTVAVAPVDANFPRLRFRAVASYCADGQTNFAKATTTPSALYMCGNDDNDGVSNAKAQTNSQAVGARGIATDFAANPPTPLYNQRFARIEGISLNTSAQIAGQFRAAGFTNTAGLLIKTSEDIAAAVQATPSAFPAVVRLAPTLQRNVLNQLRIMLANHHTYPDYAQRNVAFFLRFTAP